MSTGETEDVEGLAGGTTESTGPGLGKALLSVWHLWIATAVSAGAAYFAITFVGESVVNVLVLSLPTVLLFATASLTAYYRTQAKLAGAASESTGPGLGPALVSVWYLWVGTAVSVDAAYVAYTLVGASSTDMAIFSLPAVLFLVSAISQSYYRTQGGLTRDASESTSLGPGQALVSVWYLWVASALSANAAYIAQTNPRLEASATDTLLFAFTTVLIFVSSLAVAYYRTR